MRLERSRVRHVALDALRHGILRLPKIVALEGQLEVLVNVGYREKVLEDALETDVFPVLRGGVQLEERLESPGLDVEEMRHVHPLIELRERELLHQFRHVSPTAGANSPTPVAAKFLRSEKSETGASIVVRRVGIAVMMSKWE